MKKTNKEIVLSYSFFLVWLLSFLYNGPILPYVFKQTHMNISYLAIAYIVAPALVCFVFVFFIRKVDKSLIIMECSLAVCMVGTIMLIFLIHQLTIFAAYAIGAVLGISSVLFIAGWGVLFVYNINIKNMMRIMGLTVCLGKGILSVNKILCGYHLEKISIGIILVCLFSAYYLVVRLRKVFTPVEYEKKVVAAFDINLVLALCFTMFFVNIGGGVCQTLIFSEIQNTFVNTFFVDLGLYVFVFTILLFIRIKEEQLIMTISLTLVGVGLLIFIIYKNNPVPTYLITSTAYLWIDIVLWTMIGKVGRMFGKPLPVFFAVMGSNLLAVFIGSMLGRSLNHSLEEIYLSISISAISILLAFSFKSILERHFDKSFSCFQKLNFNIPDAGIFTDKEREILAAMLQGLKNKEIAEMVNISENTLKTHARNIYIKANVKNKKELIVLNEKGELFC